MRLQVCALLCRAYVVLQVEPRAPCLPSKHCRPVLHPRSPEPTSTAKATGTVLLSFNVNRIHKHIKNPTMTQAITQSFVYLQAMAIKRKPAPLAPGSLTPPLTTSKTRVQRLWNLSLLDRTQQDAGTARDTPEHDQGVDSVLVLGPHANPPS